jgi:hypothetical protein
MIARAEAGAQVTECTLTAGGEADGVTGANEQRRAAEEHLRARPCALCGREAAKLLCTTCGAVCEACHPQIAALRLHNVTALPAKPRGALALALADGAHDGGLCGSHNRPLEFFCRGAGCRRALCPQCLLEHKGHDFVRLDEEADRLRGELRAAAAAARAKATEAASVLSAVEAEAASLAQARAVERPAC